VIKIGAWAIGQDLNPALPNEQEMVGRFHDVFDKIHARAPSAHILLVGYPALLGLTANDSNTPYSAEQIDSFRGIAATLERVSAKSAEGRPQVHYVSLIQASETHGIESDDPWVSGPDFSFFGGPTPLHPTEKGMQEIAKLVEEKMRDLNLT
jgi:lysophospholipase L1-like esterase